MNARLRMVATLVALVPAVKVRWVLRAVKEGRSETFNFSAAVPACHAAAALQRHGYEVHAGQVRPDGSVTWSN